jgi:hypothetical protein
MQSGSYNLGRTGFEHKGPIIGEVEAEKIGN